jgi:hypothetical protein
MLIILDHSLAESVLETKSYADPCAGAVRAAAEAAARGWHVLHASVKTFDALIARADVFGPHTVEQLRRALQKSLLRDALLRSVEWQVRVEAHATEPIERELDEGRKEVALPARLVVATPSLFDRAIFIVENPNDGYFYEGLARELVMADDELRHRFNGVRITFQLMNGGGSTTAQVYLDHKVAAQNFCLAVADSDKKYPGCPPQETARALEAADAAPNQPQWNARQHTIQVRAVENLFPRASLLDACKKADPQLYEIAKALIDQHWGSAYWPFMPLKKGIKCLDVRGASANAEYWSTTLNVSTCPNRSATPCTDREDCQTYVVPSLGSSLLGKICESKPVQLQLDKLSDGHVFASAKPLYFKLLSSFCCDDPGVRSI